MGRHLSETIRLLRWKHATPLFALLALLSAAAAMMIPGPATELTGFASVLVVGAIALAAGQSWGIGVIGIAEVLLLGATWPIVFDEITTVHTDMGALLSAGIATLAALPGILLFVATLPFVVEVVLGEKDSPAQRPTEIASSVGAFLWLSSPLAGLFL